MTAMPARPDLSGPLKADTRANRLTAADELAESLKGTLVVAVDGSAASVAVLLFADALAGRLAEPLDVVLAWNFVRGRAVPHAAVDDDLERAWQRDAEDLLQGSVGAALPAPRAAGLRLHAVHGNTVPVLLAVSRSAAHLIIGSRGRGGFAGLLLGSTSEQLLRHAECPVTVVRSP
jgi:nucleotide-binding universal stress UspA family protein